MVRGWEVEERVQPNKLPPIAQVVPRRWPLPLGEVLLRQQVHKAIRGLPPVEVAALQLEAPHQHWCPSVPNIVHLDPCLRFRPGQVVRSREFSPIDGIGVDPIVSCPKKSEVIPVHKNGLRVCGELLCPEHLSLL